MAQKQAPGRLREYETIFLVKPDLPDESVDRIKDRVREIVAREGGKLIRFTVWGKKRTMYPVAKQPRAVYVHSLYLGGSNLVAEIERNLRNLDEVTRYLSVRVADDVDPESRPALEDVKLAGDVEDGRPPSVDREGFRTPEGSEEIGAEIDEEAPEEA
ncbi:MAG TPA: 30S ribosomal protein S6 [Myxococcaceae bacterium]|nr:30S ribosomal protein S6 [Myxococcaceae bacterium]